MTAESAPWTFCQNNTLIYTYNHAPGTLLWQCYYYGTQVYFFSLRCWFLCMTSLALTSSMLKTSVKLWGTSFKFWLHSWKGKVKGKVTNLKIPGAFSKKYIYPHPTPCLNFYWNSPCFAYKPTLPKSDLDI